MVAILKEIGTRKTKPIHGEILQDGLNQITLIIVKPDGTRVIKRFTKDKYAVTYCE